jgi:hypothetical protein
MSRLVRAELLGSHADLYLCSASLERQLDEADDVLSLAGLAERAFVAGTECLRLAANASVDRETLAQASPTPHRSARPLEASGERRPASDDWIGDQQPARDECKRGEKERCAHVRPPVRRGSGTRPSRRIIR